MRKILNVLIYMIQGNYKQGIERVNEILNDGRIKINNERFIKKYSRVKIMREMTDSE